ncbi:hypothetical protein R078138_00778 [Convivina praedatoris]|uniref:DUF2929 family protein n=2 Tax=Convivina praedatoris TaxID=2880963 RepID=A0ABM9D1R0_9LACO|nr:hypothetical protein R077815_00452 [Convivina sp. LMG 32447]CAH1853972.1 hypothetical protein R078138_00778 [Convivina sp. LMG 32447]CAH1854056.1 hypothetical protein LMG032447_00784 [Convivina sp. LMG 32447]
MMMKYLTVAFWAAIFGEIVGYIVSQMTSANYDPVVVAVIAVVVGELAIIAIPAVSGSAIPKKSKAKN